MSGPQRDERGRYARAEPIPEPPAKFEPPPLGADIVVCTACGALVADRAAHRAHHERLRRNSR